MGPFETTDLRRLVDLMSLIEGCFASSYDNSSTDSGYIGHINIYVATIWARLMRLFFQYRFLNSHRQFGVRLGRVRAVFPSNTVGNKPNKALQILFQAGLATHIRDIQKIWVDEVVDESRWKTYISSLKSDWDSYTLYSTVMLAVDISFLSVPLAPARSGDSFMSDFTPYLIYSSIIFSVGTIIVSVNLANQIRKYDVDSVFGAADYMASIWNLWSSFMMPPVFLQWALYSFVVALGSILLAEPDRLGVGIATLLYAYVICLAFYPFFMGLLRSLLRWMTSKRHVWITGHEN
ncbi:hypothetical protein BU15DRAFT_74758 [Melanogaster broomeanus]|nr:hypothetical protein BU15DRAFT_74758 [Melanogaster broomeanus]